MNANMGRAGFSREAVSVAAVCPVRQSSDGLVV